MEENEAVNEPNQEHEAGQETLTRVTGMYKDWFLDYASYVILERAVPAIEDGFKPKEEKEIDNKAEAKTDHARPEGVGRRPV